MPRLDELLVDRGLAADLKEAQALLLAGQVLSGDTLLERGAAKVPVDLPLRIRGRKAFASRAGEKLAAALDASKLPIEGRTCLDLGASTGGFTDVLLKRGAKRVIAVELGHQQLAWSLRQDPRVDSREHTDALRLTPEDLDGPAGFGCADLSFTSAKPFLPLFHRCLAPGAGWVLLVKPQFEVAAADLGPGGILRDETLRQAVLEDLRAAAAAAGLEPQGSRESPLPGAKGNREWLLWGRR